MALIYRTAGESHGPALFAIMEGLPAGLDLVPADIDTAWPVGSWATGAAGE